MLRPNFNESVKIAEKAVDRGQAIEQVPGRKKAKIRKVREYVDISQDNSESLERLEDLVVNLVLKPK